VSLAGSTRQHVVLLALHALQPLLSLKKKKRNKILTKLRSVETGFGMSISNILRKYASNGLREMKICECTSSVQDMKECAALCIEGVYQVSKYLESTPAPTKQIKSILAHSPTMLSKLYLLCLGVLTK